MKKSFSGCGGKATEYSRPQKGIGSGGGKVYAGKATSTKNISPASAKDHASFKGVGTVNKKHTTEY